jgi:hypothetical protein
VKIDDTIKITDIVMILAVVVAPFLAVFIQSKIEIFREERGRRLWIYRTLMATRGNRLSLDHVQALNSIELFFTDQSEKGIIEKWNEYLDHFNYPQITENDKDRVVKLESWYQRGDDLLAELLQLMGKSLGMNFDKVKLKRGVYSPRGHGDEQNEQLRLRKALLSILEQKSSLSIKVEN